MNKALDDLIIEAYVCGRAKSISAAARMAGCSRDTVRSRLRDPQFSERLREERAARNAARSAQSLHLDEAAFATLESILNDPLAFSPSERLRACELVLKYLS